MKRLALLGLLAACGRGAEAPEGQRQHVPERVDVSVPVTAMDAGAASSRPATFAEDTAFLEAHGKTIVLQAKEGGLVALSPGYQGRVMTSAVGPSGRSLGWVHRKFIEAKKTGTGFDNYGGEDRFWLGPEAGQFGLYFAPGDAFEFGKWQTPHELQEGAWDVGEQTPDRVVFKKAMKVKNWSKADFAVDVERTVRLVGRAEADKLLGVASGTLAFVAFESRNVIKNTGPAAWKRETGLLSIWVLGQFAPNDDGKIVIPFERAGAAPIVNDRYFGKIAEERLRVDAARGVLTFRSDGKERGKLGLAPGRAKPIVGSYSAEAGVLTVVQYDGPQKGAPYVDSMWEQQKTPFAGDVVNAYNDGPTAPGQPALGGFYELETSSAAAALAPGKTAAHTHRTFHFAGTRDELDPIAKKLFGVGLAELP